MCVCVCARVCVSTMRCVQNNRYAQFVLANDFARLGQSRANLEPQTIEAGHAYLATKHLPYEIIVVECTESVLIDCTHTQSQVVQRVDTLLDDHLIT